MRISPAVSALFQQLLDTIEAEVRQEFMTKLGAGGSSTSHLPRLLAHASGGKRTTGAPPRKQSFRAKGAKRTPDELAALKTAVLSAIKKNPGSRVEELGTIMGLTTKDLALPMLQLRDEKKISKKGEKRAARYTARG